MKPEGKIRIVIFIAIMMILAYFAIGFLYEIYRYANAEVKDIMIDGTDFTFVFQLFGAWVNVFCCDHIVCRINSVDSFQADRRHLNKVFFSWAAVIAECGLGAFGICPLHRTSKNAQLRSRLG